MLSEIFYQVKKTAVNDALEGGEICRDQKKHSS